MFLAIAGEFCGPDARRDARRTDDDDDESGVAVGGDDSECDDGSEEVNDAETVHGEDGEVGSDEDNDETSPVSLIPHNVRTASISSSSKSERDSWVVVK